VTTEAETEPERARRRHQRTLFDGVAGLYEETRPGYPNDIINFVVTTAGVGAGAAVLDVGCGTGQLTRPLARSGFRVMAIDIGPSLMAAARERLAESGDSTGVSFQVAAFEDFEAPDASFDLIVSGAAFHWIDPEIRFVKSARLLRPGGWLALLEYEESYDDPLGAALDAMWATRASSTGAWATRPGDAEAFAASGLFGALVHHACAQRTTRPAEAVIGVENTRATSLSWPEDERQAFNAELRQHLRSRQDMPLTLQFSATMAPGGTVPPTTRA
jgi:ubiquinone/menaquinone biosynthesis C-methylase UbiE